jgi:AhpD family alkylhydroperoxidase
LQDFFKDTVIILKQRHRIKTLMRGYLISAAFRERLMLTVTEVNGCRYCQYAHAKMALEAGLSQEEINALSTGTFQNCPEEEVPALLYAQHWAETNGEPDEEAHQKMLNIYGTEKVQAIHLAMRMIRIGNLLGNTWDYFLNWISFGHWGKSAKNDS